VFADQGRVREVLGNLLDNSLKFTPAGGHVIVSAAAEPDFVRVTVRDTGHGISAADLPHIFEQFFQSKPGDEAGRNGLGLGLFVSRDLITRQGGEMRAESELDHGTSISFTLPTAGRLADLEAPQ
jgi:signal transduction histidine kinase